MWSPKYLERLARTYWRFLTRATLGLIRVYYTEGERYVCLLFRPLKLLTFQAPEYEMDDRRGVVRWRIARGLLVARRGRGGDGYLEIDVERRPRDQPGAVNVAVEVAVANFYPADRVAAEPLRLHQHAVAHPRDRDPRLPALAGPPGLRASRGSGASCRRRRGARSVDAAAERAQRHATGFVTFAPARAFQGHAHPDRRRARRRAAGRDAPPPPSADTLVTAAPGRPQPAANGGYQAWAAPAGGGRWRLTVRAPNGSVTTPAIADFGAPAAPADRLDPVRRRRPAAAGGLLALPGRVRHRRVRRLRLRPGRGHRAEDRQAAPRRPTARPRPASSSGGWPSCAAAAARSPASTTGRSDRRAPRSG